VAAGGYLYLRLDDEIRRQVERKLSDYYHDFIVHVGSARFDADRGIAISNLTIAPKTPDGSSQPILSIDEMYMGGKLRIDQLVTNQLAIEEVAVRGAKLRMVRQASGQWNASALLPIPHFGKSTPKVKIEDASATIEYAAKPGSKPWAINEVNMQLTPIAAVPGVDVDSNGFVLEGTTVGLPARDVLFKGEIGKPGGGFDITVTATGFDLSPELLASLPEYSRDKLHGAELSGRVDLAVRLARMTSDSPIGWSGSLRLDRGRIGYPALPDALADVSIIGHADPTHLVIERLSGKLGSASLAVAFNRAGWAENAPLAVRAKVVGFNVDERFRAALPDSYGRIWDRFRPKGLVDAELQLRFDGEKWSPTFAADCHGISLTDAEKFPYPLEQTNGRVEYHPADDGSPDRLTLDLTGVGGGRPINVAVDLTHVAHDAPEGVTTGTGVAVDRQAEAGLEHAAGYRGRVIREAAPPHPVGYIKVSGTDVPIHEQLLAAIPDDKKAQQLTRSLQPEGLVDFAFCCAWKDLEQRLPVTTLDIRLKDCRIKFDKFPYPLQHVQGTVKATDWHWKLEDIEARGANVSTVMKCHGVAIPAHDSSDVELNIDAWDVPLDDTMKVALPLPVRQAWEDLRPQGRIDFSAHALKPADAVEPTIEVVLKPRAETVSIEPTMFRYRLDKMQGSVVYQKGRVDCQKIVATHDRTMFTADSGVWQATPDGGWQFVLTNVTADRLALYRDFLNAMPSGSGLQSTIERLQPTGTFALFNSSLSVTKSPQAQTVSTGWDLNLGFQQAAIQGSVPMRGISGEMRLVGRCDGKNATTAGELAIDSLVYKDIQLTNIRGPLWSDSGRLLLGEPAGKQQRQPARRLTADAYGGSLTSNIEFMRGDNPSYKIDCRAGGINLARFVNERTGTTTDVSGTLSGGLIVSGSGQTAQTLQGAGSLHVVDGHFYQLPPLVSMLKILSKGPLDKTAFNRCDMKFSIQGEHIHFDPVNLLGDAVSLYGKGDIDFSHRMDLTFFSLLGPADSTIPALKAIFKHVSPQMWQLKVAGTFEHPDVEKKLVPAMTDMIDHIQTELQEGAATISPNTASRGAGAPTR
jgi:hypothetical protein